MYAPATERLITIYNRILHMPINIDRFEDEPEDVLEIKEGTQPHTILSFLLTNDEQAFTQTEIHEATDIPRGSVGVVLSRLEERGLVRHRGRYWTIAEDERLATYAAQQAASSSSTTDDYYGDSNE
jgi:predicted transcriptional regulator of viral defense system